MVRASLLWLVTIDGNGHEELLFVYLKGYNSQANDKCFFSSRRITLVTVTRIIALCIHNARFPCHEWVKTGFPDEFGAQRAFFG